jgi:BlaI family penicillinase repressor
MHVLHRHGPCTAAEVMDRLPEAPGYSAVRALLRILEEKGHITHRTEGPRYIYSAIMPTEEAGEKAIRHTVTTFFRGSVSDAVATLLGSSETPLDEADLDRLERLIEERRAAGS